MIRSVASITLAARLAIRNRGKLVRTGGASAAVVVCFLMLCGNHKALHSHYLVNAAFANDAGHFMVFRRGAAGVLHLSDQSGFSDDIARSVRDRLRSVPGVEKVGIYQTALGMAYSGCAWVPIVAHGVDMDVESWRVGDPRYPRDLCTADFSAAHGWLQPSSTPPDVGLAHGVVRKLGLDGCPRDADHNGPRAALSLLFPGDDGGRLAVPVRTRYQYSTGRLFSEDVTVRIDRSRLSEALQRTEATYLAIFARDGADLALLESAAAQALSSYPDFELVSSVSEEVNGLEFGALEWQRAMTYFVSLLLSSVVIFLMVSLVQSEKRDNRARVAVLRANGWSHDHANLVFPLQMSFQVGFGAIVGSIMVALCSILSSSVEIPYEPPGAPGLGYLRFRFDLETSAAAVLTITSVAFVTYVAMGRTPKASVCAGLEDSSWTLG